MSDRVYNVLFLCTGNSARSVITECVLNRLGRGRFRAFSAGSDPKGDVHPQTLDLLQARNYDTSGLRSKSWDEFAGKDAPKLDFVFTVCGNVSRETCPAWLRRKITVHWGLPDPAAVKGSDTEKRQAFADCLAALSERIGGFCNLPLESLDAPALRARLEAFGAGDKGAA